MPKKISLAKKGRARKKKGELVNKSRSAIMPRKKKGELVKKRKSSIGIHICVFLSESLYIYIYYIYYTHTRGWGPFGSWKIYGFHIFQTIDTSMYGQSLPQSNCVNAVHCHKHCRNHCPNHCHFTRSSAGFTIAVDDDDVDTVDTGKPLNSRLPFPLGTQLTLEMP